MEKTLIGGYTLKNRTANKAYYKSRQRCVLCGGQDAYTLNDRSLCADCAEKRRIITKNYRDAHPEQIKAYRAEYDKTRRAAGLCHTCGKPTKNGRSRCPGCQSKENRRRREKLREDGVVNLPRGENGVCWTCNKRPALHG
ncbi:MAG: hypothetical protein J6X53_02620, partial [Abditibacteriota bacterium]|nr:hypothetical protein [Abditibacteriota bacterium]